MKKEKTILLLTGMHRSGTSLLGGLVNAIGIDLPGRLIKGDIYNIDGYYEREDIVEIQEDLLISLGRWWPTIYGCEEMPKNWISNNNIVGHKKRLKEIIQNILE